MRMELIQPFINAADAVFAESLKGPTKIVDVEMAEDAYRRKGVAALILIKGDIEGRVILDLAPEVAVNVPRNGLRTREHGHRQFRNAAQRPGLSFQGVSARSAHERGGLGRQRGHRGAGHLHRDALRRHLFEHRHALSAPPPRRTLRRPCPRLNSVFAEPVRPAGMVISTGAGNPRMHSPVLGVEKTPPPARGCQHLRRPVPGCTRVRRCPALPPAENHESPVTSPAGR